MNGVDLVLFDLDGTLVETAPGLCAALQETLRALGLPGATLQQVERWIGHGAAQLLLQALAQACGREPAAVRESSLWRSAQLRFAADLERVGGTGTRPCAGAREVLDALGERGVRRALVTNKEQRFALPLLRQHGLRASLDAVVCGDSFPTCKPDPAGVLDCLRRFGVGAGRALFVGDSAIDVATARNAGVRVWALAQGYNGGAPIAAARPDRIIESLAAVLEAAAPGVPR